ncbi:MAG: flavin reductase family protein, partial [Gammaproteobacteria bacterium]|nr:flavin reductase family protein [Gammaproteobacteria bacterium]
MTSENLIPSTELRKALGTFATGVTVVTAESEAGELAGLTVNSFTSVSFSPPLILWCLASSSENLSTFKSTEYFAVNILASDQRSLSNHFATRKYDKFKNISYTSGMGNSPLIDGCVSWIQCKTTQMYEAGDHWIIIGEIVKLKTTSKESLIFNQSHYGVSLPLPIEENDTNIPDDLIYSDSDSYFSLLFQAIHSYQENFEKHQHEIIESDYEARVMAVLHHYQSTT